MINWKAFAKHYRTLWKHSEQSGARLREATFSALDDAHIPWVGRRNKQGHYPYLPQEKRIDLLVERYHTALAQIEALEHELAHAGAPREIPYSCCEAIKANGGG